MEQLQPLAAQGCFVNGEAGDIAARPREAFHESGSNRIGNCYEHDWNCLRVLLKSRNDGRRLCHDEIGGQAYELLCKSTDAIGFAFGPAILDLQVASRRPAELLQADLERADLQLS